MENNTTIENPSKKTEKETNDQELFGLLKTKKFDIRNFHKEFTDHSKDILEKLMKMQSNYEPLKKGGVEIAYMADVIIINNRQQMTIPENNLLDIFSGEISSHPDDESYVINAKQAIERLGGYRNMDSGYWLLKKAVISLAKKPLVFEYPLPNGNKRTVNVSWYETLTYSGKDETLPDEDSYISFKPTNFFKALMISSSISHGAHYSIKVASQINSKYIRTLYYYLESRKRFCEYPGGTAGHFYISLEEIKELLKTPETYRANDVSSMILKKALEINEIEGIDFNFSYTPKKEGRRIVGWVFDVVPVNTIPLKEKKEENDETVNEIDPIIEGILKSFGYDEKDHLPIYREYVKYKRDIVFLTKALARTTEKEDVENETAYLMTLLRKGLNAKKRVEAKNKKKSVQKSSNRFNNFTQREYDYAELEKQLLKKQNS